MKFLKCVGFLICVYMCICEWGCALVCSFPYRPEESIWSCRIGVSGGCKSPQCGCWEHRENSTCSCFRFRIFFHLSSNLSHDVPLKLEAHPGSEKPLWKRYWQILLPCLPILCFVNFQSVTKTTIYRDANVNGFLGYVFMTSHHCDRTPKYINFNEGNLIPLSL